MSERNILTDLIDGFTSGQTFDERWKAANKATKNLGGVALNIAEIDDSTGAAKWLSSTMSADWMTQYMAQEYYACDAVLDHCMGSYETVNFSTGNKIRDPFASSNALQLDGDLYDFGYRSFLAGAHTSRITGNRIATSMVCDASTLHQSDPGLVNQFNRVAAVISAFIGSPYDESSGDVHFIRQVPLSSREQEVLSLLAHGFLNARIADKLGVAEVTVRAHVISARKKLGAATREQAVAIAIRDHLISI
ncbi:MAG: helix-turn-helix transcriptional regulator [Paracoccaceae bacterium]|nr:helix-turn-helix transcriptional regulator [Paracoccaceae bacterium]MDG1739749.1 helix-turn-helix transcriptional regulator [Paracoccaceae bacterium]MDG2260288.1 helix-turn-helix transcriptional regulator [Paracoccaceae bacterium]